MFIHVQCVRLLSEIITPNHSLDPLLIIFIPNISSLPDFHPHETKTYRTSSFPLPFCKPFPNNPNLCSSTLSFLLSPRFNFSRLMPCWIFDLRSFLNKIKSSIDWLNRADQLHSLGHWKGNYPSSSSSCGEPDPDAIGSVSTSSVFRTDAGLVRFLNILQYCFACLSW